MFYIFLDQETKENTYSIIVSTADALKRRGLLGPSSILLQI